MGLEWRGSNICYYRKARVGDMVRSEYVGAGETAKLLAQLDAIEREQKRSDALRLRERQADFEAPDRELENLSGTTKAIVEAYLLVNGFHQLKRTWRKRRQQR